METQRIKINKEKKRCEMKEKKWKIKEMNRKK